MNNIVVTGADGFIGRHLVKTFSDKGMAVDAIVVKNSPLKSYIEGLPNVAVFEAAPNEYLEIAYRLRKNPFAFFHLAWNGVSPENRNSYEIQKSNIEISEYAVRLAKAIQSQKFIVIGSTSEYAFCDQPINEKSVPSPQTVYSSIKVSVRYMCEALCKELELSFIYAAVTGIYGADRIDNNVITYTIKALLNGEKPMLSRLEQKWDYIHIDDLACALYLIGKKGKGGSFYCVGHGDNWELSNYIYIIRNIINPDLPLGIGEIPYIDGKIPSSCVDLTRLKEDTGFEPGIPFEIGIKEVIRAISEGNR